MAPKLTLYFFAGSGPSRAVFLLAKYLKLDFEVKNINLGAGEQLKPEFLKLNPQHTVPVLVDGDFVLSESRAILAYLVNSRAPGSDLYPTNPKARALVDHRLYYDSNHVYAKVAEIFVSFTKKIVHTKSQTNFRYHLNRSHLSTREINQSHKKRKMR